MQMKLFHADIIASYIVRTCTASNNSVVNQLHARSLVMVQVANTTFSYMQLHKELLPESISLGLIFPLGIPPGSVTNKSTCFSYMVSLLLFTYQLCKLDLHSVIPPTLNSTAVVMLKIIICKSQLESQTSHPLDQCLYHFLYCQFYKPATNAYNIDASYTINFQNYIATSQLQILAL